MKKFFLVLVLVFIGLTTLPAEEGPPVTIVNNTSNNIRLITLKHSRTSGDVTTNYEDEQIFNPYLGIGNSVTIKLANPIREVNRYDIEVEYTNGAKSTLRDVLVQANGKITISSTSVSRHGHSSSGGSSSSSSSSGSGSSSSSSSSGGLRGNSPCYKCFTSGKQDCVICFGRGYNLYSYYGALPCIFCGSSGKLTCTNCNGSGYVTISVPSLPELPPPTLPPLGSGGYTGGSGFSGGFSGGSGFSGSSGTSSNQRTTCYSCSGERFCTSCNGTGRNEYLNPNTTSNICGVCQGKRLCVGCNGKGYY